MEKAEYFRNENEFNQLYEEYAFQMPLDTKEHVLHFVNHSELEMAFEGFCIDLMTVHVKLSLDNARKFYRIGLSLGLDKESIYDPDFWTKFKSYIESVKE